MNKKIITILGSVVLVAGAAVATFFILDILNSKPQAAMAPASDTTPAEPTNDSEPTAEPTDIDLQRQDVATKNIVTTIVAELMNYQSNNRGALPANDAQLAQFTQNYLADTDLTNPKTTSPYSLQLNADQITSDTISIKPNYTCNPDDSAAAAVVGTSRQFALVTTLPSGANYCLGS